MKKVRYAMGAAALAPMTVAFAAPNAAIAAPSNSAEAASKTVSLTAARTTAIPNTSCTASKNTGWHYSTSGNHGMHYFWDNPGALSTCVGTVVGWQRTLQPQESLRTRIYWNPGTGLKHNSYFLPNVGGIQSPNQGIHQTFSASGVQVCVAFIKSTTGGVIGNATCYTV